MWWIFRKRQKIVAILTIVKILVIIFNIFPFWALGRANIIYQFSFLFVCLFDKLLPPPLPSPLPIIITTSSSILLDWSLVVFLHIIWIYSQLMHSSTLCSFAPSIIYSSSFLVDAQVWQFPYLVSIVLKMSEVYWTNLGKYVSLLTIVLSYPSKSPIPSDRMHFDIVVYDRCLLLPHSI